MEIDASNSVWDVDVGLVIPRPPSLAGKATLCIVLAQCVLRSHCSTRAVCLRFGNFVLAPTVCLQAHTHDESLLLCQHYAWIVLASKYAQIVLSIINTSLDMIQSFMRGFMQSWTFVVYAVLPEITGKWYTWQFPTPQYLYLLKLSFPLVKGGTLTSLSAICIST